MTGFNQPIIGNDLPNNTNETALRLRIDTTPLIDKLEEFLGGYITTYTNDNEGNTICIKTTTGKPLVNSEGLQSLLKFYSQVINKITVQGNTEKNEMLRILRDTQQDLAFELMLHGKDWDVADEHRRHICRTMMKTFHLFISRTKDNKERVSYDNTVRMLETNTIRDNQGNTGFSLLAPFRKNTQG